MTESAFERFSDLAPDDRESLIAEEARKHDLSPAQMKALLLRSWRFIGRPKQQPPEGDWTFWVIRAGRGFGKTICAAHWAKDRALEAKVRFALVAPTFADVRDTMIEGETGILSAIPNLALLGQSREHAWNRSIGELTLANGSKFRAFSSETPNRIRGPQHHYAWLEEISSWKDAVKGDVEDTTWSNVKLSTRLGENPQFVITTTPKPNRLTKLLVELAKTDSCVMTIGSSYENRSNLSEAWWRQVIAPLEGTRQGRQEIEAELLEDVEGALWSRAMIEAVRVTSHPDLARLIVAVDPNVSSEQASNSAGIIVAGRGARDRYGYVLADRTITRGGPRAWATAAVEAYHEYGADRIVAEKNNGGEMVEITIHAVDDTVPVKLVHASRGKRARAEPVAARYEGAKGWQDDPHVKQPTVRHVGAFPELEDECCSWTPDMESPDRMDALVWAISDLLIENPGSGRYHSATASHVQLPSALDQIRDR